jgi:hypothetical protein
MQVNVPGAAIQFVLTVIPRQPPTNGALIHCTIQGTTRSFEGIERMGPKPRPKWGVTESDLVRMPIEMTQ